MQEDNNLLQIEIGSEVIVSKMYFWSSYIQA